MRLHAGPSQVGTLLQTLRSTGVEKHTLVVATADHGASYLGKGSPHEAGIRVPLVVRWPAVLSSGRTDRVAMLLDVAPSLRAAAVGATAGTRHARHAVATEAAEGGSGFTYHGLPDLLTPSLLTPVPARGRVARAGTGGARPIFVEVGYARAVVQWPWKLVAISDLHDRCATTPDGGCRNLHGQLIEVTAAAAAAGARNASAGASKRYGLGSMTYDAPARHAGARAQRQRHSRERASASLASTLQTRSGLTASTAKCGAVCLPQPSATASSSITWITTRSSSRMSSPMCNRRSIRNSPNSCSSTFRWWRQAARRCWRAGCAPVPDVTTARPGSATDVKNYKAYKLFKYTMKKTR